MEVMHRCMEWMMGLGWAGLSLGVFLLAGLVVLVVLLIRQTWQGSRT